MRQLRRASAEEFSIIGVMLLLVGISWTAYAYAQPLQYDPTSCNPTGLVTLPPCYDFSSVAIVFYALGIISILSGIYLLSKRSRYNVRRTQP